MKGAFAGLFSLDSDSVRWSAGFSRLRCVPGGRYPTVVYSYLYPFPMYTSILRLFVGCCVWYLTVTAAYSQSRNGSIRPVNTVSKLP